MGSTLFLLLVILYRLHVFANATTLATYRRQDEAATQSHHASVDATLDDTYVHDLTQTCLNFEGEEVHVTVRAITIFPTAHSPIIVVYKDLFALFNVLVLGRSDPRLPWLLLTIPQDPATDTLEDDREYTTTSSASDGEEEENSDGESVE